MPLTDNQGEDKLQWGETTRDRNESDTGEDYGRHGKHAQCCSSICCSGVDESRFWTADFKFNRVNQQPGLC